jgi:antitoxin VapB
MGLNIKNAGAESIVRELATLTGEGLTETIVGAVREKLGRLKAEKKSQTVEEFLESIRPLQMALRANKIDPNDNRTSRELMDDLYDEHGLPK